VITVVQFEWAEEEVVLASFSTISRHPDGGTVKNTKFCEEDTESQSRDELSTSPVKNQRLYFLSQLAWC
jgi:hypothetical protein